MFVETLLRAEEINENNLYGLFSEIVLHQPDSFKKTEYKDILAAFPHKGLTECIHRFTWRLNNSGTKASTLWDTTLSLWIKNNWPLALDRNTMAVKSAFNELLIKTRESFPNAFKLLNEKSLIGPYNKEFICYNLKEQEDYNYIQKHTKEVIQFLYIVINPSPDFTPLMEYGLEEILDEALSCDPSIVDLMEYKKLRGE